MNRYNIVAKSYKSETSATNSLDGVGHVPLSPPQATSCKFGIIILIYLRGMLYDKTVYVNCFEHKSAVQMM